jgi:ubiquinone/menaquinone biosynthesis C-methylase UbiE
MTAVDIGCGIGYFSKGMAKIVGDAGKVISVDVQEEMLDITRKRAEKDGVAQRIRLIRVEQGDIGVTDQVDFALAFWMVHEVVDTLALFRQVFLILKQTGTFLIAEPKMHVTRSRFDEILSLAEEAGFKISDSLRLRFSRTAALKKF